MFRLFGADSPRRGWRIALACLGAVVVVFGAVLLVGYLTVNHLASNVHRVHVGLPKVSQVHKGPAQQQLGLNVLLTGGATTGKSGLLMLLHINKGDKAGGIVSFPPTVVVPVPGHGNKQLWNAMKFGGPTLLVKTIEAVTGVQIDHYAAISPAQVPGVINAVGGVSVTIPDQSTSFGHVFTAGTNQLSALTAVAYAREPSLTESQRVARQNNLIRAILQKVADENLLNRPVTAYRVVNALTKALTVDSNFTNSGLESLAMQLRGLRSGAGTFVTAPTVKTHGKVTFDPAESTALWSAIRGDSIAAFATQYPQTITPAAPS